ncbi:MAG: hypothetical protein JKY53_05180 [Flavobacteriales bacterium]|nr:hypothetical protein [Flavobacteriales bacterium]
MKKEFLISVLISLSFLTLGFTLIEYDMIGFGVSFFVFLPFLLGYILGTSTIKKVSCYGLVFSLIVFFILLFVGGLEGMGCILMAMPLVIGAVVFGVLVKYILNKYGKKRNEENKIKISILPLFLFVLLGYVESNFIKGGPAVDEVVSEIILPYSAMEVYNAIKSVDTLDAEKPFLMNLDLPIPQKCILSEEKVGGIRTCYFEGGLIVEKITELEKGVVLRMDVIDYQLTGRKWLGFKEAIYTFETVDDGCKMTRITTYSSELYPRAYWRPMEQIGIEQEHQYVFNNLVKDLKNATDD